MVSDDRPPWRVFVSHTSELREYPKGGSYVDAVERAIAAAGHVVVDMRDFPSADETPAQLCIDRVRDCDVYIGVLGARYGSPVPDRPEVSYTELEYNTATEAGMDRLVFAIDSDADGLGIPLRALTDLEYGTRQLAFRQRIPGTVQRFRNPDNLLNLVERSLGALAETRARIRSGVTREQQPTVPPPAPSSKFINRPPMTAPLWFQNRHVETGLITRLLASGLRRPHRH